VLCAHTDTKLLHLHQGNDVCVPVCLHACISCTKKFVCLAGGQAWMHAAHALGCLHASHAQKSARVQPFSWLSQIGLQAPDSGRVSSAAHLLPRLAIVQAVLCTHVHIHTHLCTPTVTHPWGLTCLCLPSLACSSSPWWRTALCPATR